LTVDPRFVLAARLQPAGEDAVTFIERFLAATADLGEIQRIATLRAALEPIGLRAARDALHWIIEQGPGVLEDAIGAYLSPAGTWTSLPAPWTAGVPTRCPLPKGWAGDWSSAQTSDRQVLADWLQARGDARGGALAHANWAVGVGVDAIGLWALAEVGRGQIRMRWVPGGAYQRGRPGAVSAMRPHTVTLSAGFWMSETVVVAATQERRWMSRRRGLWPLMLSGGSAVEALLETLQPDLPARLPTEAEWECACRAGSATDTWWGSRADNERYAPTFDVHTPVAQGPANPLGLFDMNAGVAEPCADGFAAYPGDATDPIGIGRQPVTRGGGPPEAWRRNVQPPQRVGVRLVVSA
jgi:hypothetical protein